MQATVAVTLLISILLELELFTISVITDIIHLMGYRPRLDFSLKSVLFYTLAFLPSINWIVSWFLELNPSYFEISIVLSLIFTLPLTMLLYHFVPPAKEGPAFDASKITFEAVASAILFFISLFMYIVYIVSV